MFPHAFSSKVFLKIRKAVRAFRVAILTVILLTAAALLWLNRIGLPQYFQQILLAELERQHVYLQAGRIRLEGFTRVVLERVQLRDSNTRQALEVEVPQAELKFNSKALRHARIEIEGLRLRRAALKLPLSETNHLRDPLLVTNINADLSFHADDRWELTAFQGDVMGARLRAAATVTNVSAFSHLGRPAPGSRPTTRSHWRAKVAEALEAWRQIQFAVPPEVRLVAFADASRPESLRVDVKIHAPEALSPWGRVEKLFAQAVLTPGADPADFQANLLLRLDGLRTPWTQIEKLEATSHTTYPLRIDDSGFHSKLELKAAEIRTQWIHLKKPRLQMSTSQKEGALNEFGSEASLNGESVTAPWFESRQPMLKVSLSHQYPLATLSRYLAATIPSTNSAGLSAPASPANPVAFWSHDQPWHGQWRLELGETTGGFGRADRLSFAGTAEPAAGASQENGADWPGARWSRHLALNWSGRVEDAKLGSLALNSAQVSAEWRPPTLSLRTVDGLLAEGSFNAQATLDLQRRLFDFELRAAPDLPSLARWFPPETKAQLEKLRAGEPPHVRLHTGGEWPAWDAPAEKWRFSALSNIWMETELSATNLSFADFSLPSAALKANYTNGVVRLSQLEVVTTNGFVRATGDLLTDTLAYHCKVASRFNPEVLTPLLPQKTARGVRFVRFTEPPWIDAELQGGLREPLDFQAQGSIGATNFQIRMEPFADAAGFFTYQDKQLNLTDLLAHRGTNEMMSASAARIDLTSNLLYLTNGFSTADHSAITRIIGPMTAAAVAPYQFAGPPAVRVNGRIALGGREGNDLFFSVAGGDFRYWRFHVPAISGDLHWQDDRLWVTNLQAPFYGGKLWWQGDFTFFPKGRADYSFSGRTEELNLSLILADLAPSASQIEGLVNGTLRIRSANTTSIDTWQGDGEAEMTDGFLWAIPLFGSLSGFIDNFSPGLGKSRLRAGTASFEIADGAVQTRDMEVRAPAFRLKYLGKVGFDGSLDAKAELELLRDAPFFGKAFAIAFWPISKVFETRVSGTLEHPKTEAMHIPKFILAPLRPLQTLKNLLPKAGKTEAPDGSPPSPQP